MDFQSIINQSEKNFQQIVTKFSEDITKIRTGRASPSMLDGVVVTAYGAPMPLKQVATITAAEAQLLQISPFDPNNLQAISTAIREEQNLGLNPMDDGKVVRVPIPPLTTERRQQIVKQLHDRLEQSMISIRNSRHDALKELDEIKKNISQDDFKRASDNIDEIAKKTKEQLEQKSSEKEQEIMKI